MVSLPEDVALAQYDAVLDERYGTFEVMGLVWAAHTVLKCLDPVAYDVGFFVWCDTKGIEIS